MLISMSGTEDRLQYAYSCNSTSCRQPYIFLNLVNNLTTPLPTINLLSTSHRQPHTTASKQRSTSPRINTQIKVQIGTILVCARQTILSTQRVALCRTEVGDLDYNGCTESFLVAGGVGGCGEFPAGSAGWAGAGACAYAEFVLGYCG
jgi:hypothetical protein